MPKYLLSTICIMVSIFTASSFADVESVNQGYELLEGDILEISVWKEDGLVRELMIGPDGNISFPLIGQVQARGQTTQSLQRQLTKMLSAFIPQPSITVILKGASGSKFYVIGKVNRPGEFPLLGPVSVLQALSIAGGMSTFADVNDIKIIRREDGKERAIRFKYGDIEDGDDLGQNIMLRGGDVIVVP